MGKKVFAGIAVLFVAAGLCLTGCPTSNSDNGNPAQEAADAFKSAHAGVLGKTIETITVSDEAALTAALAAYEALSADAKALVTAEKDLLDILKAKLEELNRPPAQVAADAFKEDHAVALGKTADTVALADGSAVNAALTAYNALGADAKLLVAAEKTLLDSLKAKIDQLQAEADRQAAANTFRTGHAGALGKTVDNVAIGDRDAVDTALAAYNALAVDVKALLGTEKSLLDSLATKIDQLQAAADAQAAADGFKAAHAGALGMTVDTVVGGDRDTVNAALAAYNALSADAQALVAGDKTLLDSLKAKIDQLLASTDADAFKTAHAGTLGKTVSSVTIADGIAVNAALAAYNALSADAKTLVTAEKTLLDSLKAKIDSLGTGRFTVIAGDGDLLSNVPASLSISRGAGDVLVIEAAEGLGSIQWSLNGTDIPAPRGTAREITVEAVSYIPGRYTLRLYVEQEVEGVTVPYSINFTFTVAN